MPVKKFKLYPGYFYHIYNRVVDNNLLFREWKNYDFFLDKIKKYLLPEAEILAFCLMPNHYHLLIKLTNQDYSKAMQKLALSYVVAYNRIYSRKGRLFSSPYQRIHIKNPMYLLELSRYIHLNPIKAGLSKTPLDWKYSSCAEFVGLKAADFINPTYILDILSDDLSSTLAEQHQAYQNYVQEWIDQRERDEVP